MTLAEAKEGDIVLVERVNGEKATKKRLEEMGLLKDVELKIERYAPLFDPIQVTVRGYSLALRVSEGKMIDIKLISNKILPEVFQNEENCIGG